MDAVRDAEGKSSNFAKLFQESQPGTAHQPLKDDSFGPDFVGEAQAKFQDLGQILNHEVSGFQKVLVGLCWLGIKYEQ